MAPLSTFAPVGAVERTVSVGGGAAVSAEADDEWFRGTRTKATAATANAATAPAISQRRTPALSFFRECLPDAIATGMLPADSAYQFGREAQMAAVIWARRPGSVTFVPFVSRT